MRAIFGKMWCIAKYGLFFVNLIFTLAGLALVGVSIACTLQFNVILEVVPQQMGAISRVVIILGLLIFFIAFFGCWIRENKNYLIMYGVSMFFLASSKIYLAVVIFQNMQVIDKLVAVWLGAAFADHTLKDKFHEIESSYRCCGTTGPESYLLPVLPMSCCPEPAEHLKTNQICTVAYAYKGCNKILSMYCSNYGHAIGIVIILVIVVELIAMLLSFYLYSSIDNKKRNA